MNRNTPEFHQGAEPFFRIIMEGLAGLVDGEHFWDAVAENAVFEFMYDFPGFESKIEGRDNYRNWFAGYSAVLQSSDNLRVHTIEGGKTVVLEYQVHGFFPQTKKPYHNKFCSIITIENRKIVYWRDYMDSLAAMLAGTE